jgi:hypothetical protein
MKYSIKFISFSLLAGLTISTSSCREPEPQLKFLQSKILIDFPSASAIAFSDNRFYVFGDDAPFFLILDSQYRTFDTIHFSQDTTARLSKKEKPDIESAMIIPNDAGKYLHALGSLSTPERKTAYSIPLSNPRQWMQQEFTTLAQKLSMLPELNIEGMTEVRSRLVLSNRANNTNRVNKLLVFDSSLNHFSGAPDPKIIDLSMERKKVVGISDLFYLEEDDLLFFTASEEETANAIDDGLIGESYFGWISDFSKKLQMSSISPNQMINLSEVNRIFSGQKIEGLHVKKHNSSYTLHLVSDNDKGLSRLYKLEFGRIVH